MSIYRYSFFIIALALFLTGCAGKETSTASQEKSPISKVKHAKKQGLQSTALFVVVRDERLAVEIERANTAMMSGAYMYGAVGALVAGAADAYIESQRREEAETFVAPIREKIKTFDIAALLTSEISEQIKGISTFNIVAIQQVSEFNRKNLSKLLKESNSDSAIVIDAGVALTPNFRSLKVISKAHFYKDGYGGGRQLFETEYSHYSEAPSEAENPDIAEYWSKEQGKELITSINSGVINVAQELANRFEDSPLLAKNQN